MIEKRELPFVEPPIRFSPSIDYFLSLVSLNIDKTLPWILENYIDVVFNKTKGSNYFVMEFLDIYKLWWNCPFINVSRIPRRIVETGTIGEFVKTLIDNELYVMLIIDTFYIPEYTTYRKEHLAHEIFIYGYDSECLLVSDYFDFLLPKRKKIRFSDLSNGYNFLDRNEKDYLCGIVTFEINKDVILNGKPDVQFVNAKRLKKAGLDCCHLSLNGSTQEIHSKTRDGFMETMDAMRIVSEVKVPCAINWVANHANVPDLIHVIELAQSMQVNYISILANKPSRDMELFFPYSYSDLIWLKKLCEKYPEYLNVESCFNELRLLLYGTKIPVVDKGCKAGRFHMAIDVRGTFLPCPHLDALGEKMKDIATYWNTSEVLGQIRECFRHGMGNRVSQCDISETSLCNHCRYKQCCNPCYIGQNGQLLRCADRRTCIIFNKSS